MSAGRPALGALWLAAGLVACEAPPAGDGAVAGLDGDTIAVTDAVAPEDTVAQPTVADSVWSIRVTGTGIALSLAGPAGDPLLRIGCVRDPAVMTVDVETFTQIGSEERLSFGVDGEPYVFVADVSEPRPVGVHAEAPIDAGLLARFSGAREISAVYGAQRIGPVTAPDEETTAEFLETCRTIAG